ncbi:AAA ATPase domain-containing protein [Colletotrichum scovillei]|nr:AAA ATPase domain-containing protein [Colletotrichum scovillei]
MTVLRWAVEKHLSYSMVVALLSQDLPIRNFLSYQEQQKTPQVSLTPSDMADAIGTAASVVGLIGALLKTIQEIQKARERVKNAPKKLDEISSSLQVTSQTASLVRQEPRLQTPAVVHQLEILNAIAEELNQFSMKLEKKSRKGSIRRFTSALKTQDADETELANISNRLANATAELGTRISVIHVGLTGNLEDGFRVMLKLLEDTNSKVFQVLGKNLTLVDRLRSRGFTIVGNGAILLGPADIRSLQLENELPSQQHLSGGSHALNLREFDDSEFLFNLSSIHPNLNTASHHQFGYQSSAKSFNASRLASNLQEQEGKPFIFVDDETGLGHSMFSLSVLRPVRFHRYDITAYFFCKDPQSDPISFITTSTILGGLAYVLLRHSDGPELLTRMNRTFGHELKISRAEVSRAGLFHRMLGEIFRHAASRQRRPLVIVIDGIDFEGSEGDRADSNVSRLIHHIQQLQHENPETCLKWVLTGKFSDTLRGRLMELAKGADTTEIILKPDDVAAAFGLQEAIHIVAKTAAVWGHFMEIGVTAQTNPTSDDISWFRYCKLAQSWCAKPTESEHDSRVLWLRKGLHSFSAANGIGLQVASGKLLNKEESPVVAFFSFATLEAGANQSPKSGREQMNQAQVVWCIVAQLLRGQFGPESSLAEILVRLSLTAREALNSICSAFGKSESSSKPNANDDGPASPVGETITSWYRQIRGLTRDYFSKVATVMSACLEDIRKDGKCVVLILDGLELQSQSARMRLLTWIAKLGHSVRALLCIDDTRKDSTGVESRWAEVMSNALIVDETTEWRECIESLRFDGMHQRRDQVADPLPATNQWLWETEEFQEWRSSGKILWIMGKAGSGKSVLAKNIQQRLQRDVPNGDPNDDPFVCDWFYSARGPDFEAKDASMLRALTFNILSSSKTTFEPATSIYRARFDAERQDDDWLLSELSDLFTTLALSPSTPRTLAVIDALDESESVTGPSGLKSTHKGFDLLQMFTGIASSRDSRVRFVLLSRPESVISKSLSNCLKIKMEQYNNRDISIMIEGGIEKLRAAWQDALSSDADHDDLAGFYEDSDASTDSQCYESQSPNDDLDIQEETLGKIRTHLETHANGVILWVILIIRQLLLLIEDERLFTTQDLMDSLIASPPEVEELYIKFLEGLKDSSTSKELSKTKTILEWIVGSQRRSSLQLTELREVIAISEMGEHRQFSHDSLGSRRMVIGKHLWPKFCRSIQMYCGPLIEILDDCQMSRLDSRHKIRRAEPNWTIQLSHQTVNSFLQTPGRSGEFYIEAAKAEEMVTNQAYRYLGIRASSSEQVSCRSAAEGERDPILALELAVAPLLRESLKIGLPTTRQYTKSEKRPLAKFALDVIVKSCPDRETILQTLGTADTDGLTPKDWIAIPWFADLCFTPTFPGTSLESFIFFCCVKGQTEALKTFTLLKDEYSEQHKKTLMASGRDYQIICGAVKAFMKVRDKHHSCLNGTLEALRALCEEKLQQKLKYCSTRVESNASRGKSDRRGDIENLQGFLLCLSEQKDQLREAVQNCRGSERKLSEKSERLVGCSEINQAFQELSVWMRSNLVPEFEISADTSRQIGEPESFQLGSTKDLKVLFAEIDQAFPLMMKRRLETTQTCSGRMSEELLESGLSREILLIDDLL